MAIRVAVPREEFFAGNLGQRQVNSELLGLLARTFQVNSGGNFPDTGGNSGGNFPDTGGCNEKYLKCIRRLCIHHMLTIPE
jgi:hypothetical protein